MSLESDQKTLRAMIRLFCQAHHGSKSLCEGCSTLLDRSQKRLAKCPFGADKPTCQNCRIHCHSPEMRRQIAEVMRFSGPRMLFRHPILALRHLRQAKKPIP
jgi:hypothetical protein